MAGEDGKPNVITRDLVKEGQLGRIVVAVERIADAMERVVTLFERLLEDGLPRRR